MMTKQSGLALPLTFRGDMVTALMACLRAGDSCSIIGVGSVGKSNLLRFLLRRDVQHHYLLEDTNQFLFVYVDINKILKQSANGLFELILHQLLVELGNQNADPAALRELDDLHSRAAAPQTRRLALRYLDRALRLVCNQLGRSVVLLLDEFDELCRTMAAQGFAGLRALRDEYKYRLMYVMATRLELTRLRENSLEVEAFEELISSHVFWLGPYAEADARFMLQRLAKRSGKALDDKLVQQLLVATGCHPGLLREGYYALHKREADFVCRLATLPQIQAECQRLWLSLPANEQQFLVRVTNANVSQADDPIILDRLRQKKVIIGSQATDTTIFAPIFTSYISQDANLSGAQVVVEAERHLAWVNGREITNLTRLEFDLLHYLTQHSGEVLSRDQLISRLYSEDEIIDTGISDNRLDTLVKRLRKKIEPNPKEPRYIKTVHGRGYLLNDD